MHKIMLTAMTLTLAAAAAVGVAPGQWHHSSEADFQSAQRDGTVVNSRGDVLLGRKIDILLASEDAPAAISAVVVRDGVVYAASGADGRIVRIDEDGKVDTFATIPAGMVTSMALRGRTLLVGGTGKKAGIYVVSPEGESQRLFADEDVTYVWDILPTDETTLFAATGPNGRVYRIDADGKGEVILDAGSLIKNILCLAASDDGDIYAGTDRKGLIYRVDPKTRRGRVILDAEEAEIAAIVPDGRGGLYAATSDATKGQGEAPTGEKTGRADTEAVVGELGDDAGDGDDDEPPLPDTPDDDGDGGDDGENAPEESDEGAVVPPVDLDAGADATVTGRPGPGEKTKPTPVAPQPPRPGGNGGAKRIRTQTADPPADRRRPRAARATRSITSTQRASSTASTGAPW
ncbi:MAG: hypothetical protein GVY16_07560 [Planctomycetes bacterium]|jgi:sugar lactone lactonase YvrE|nr:hypothetical protein [Planctomycetota bacterium]